MCQCRIRARHLFSFVSLSNCEPGFRIERYVTQDTDTGIETGEKITKSYHYGLYTNRVSVSPCNIRQKPLGFRNKNKKEQLFYENEMSLKTEYLPVTSHHPSHSLLSPRADCEYFKLNSTRENGKLVHLPVCHKIIKSANWSVLVNNQISCFLSGLKIKSNNR